MWHARPRIFGREGAVGAVVMALGLCMDDIIVCE